MSKVIIVLAFCRLIPGCTPLALSTSSAYVPSQATFVAVALSEPCRAGTHAGLA